MSRKQQGLHNQPHHNDGNDEELDPAYRQLLLYAKKGKVCRPPNAFMLFARDHRRIISKTHPNETNKSISTILGQVWKSSPSEKKTKYHNLAKKLDQQHKILYPEYSYNPKDARIRKKTRLRLKSEQIAAAKEFGTQTYNYMAQPAFPEFADSRKNASKDRNTRFFSGYDDGACNSTEPAERSALKYQEVGETPLVENASATSDPANKRDSDEYCPPDLTPQAYPLAGAMDDPPVEHLPSDVHRMRHIAESLASSGCMELANSPPAVAAEAAHNEHGHLAHRHVHMMPWKMSSHPYYFNRRYPIPMAYHMDRPSYSGHHPEVSGHYPAMDMHMPFTPPHPYLNTQYFPCPCTSCKHTALYDHKVMRGCTGSCYPYIPHPCFPDNPHSLPDNEMSSYHMPATSKAGASPDTTDSNPRTSAPPPSSALPICGRSPPVEMLSHPYLTYDFPNHRCHPSFVMNPCYQAHFSEKKPEGLLPVDMPTSTTTATIQETESSIDNAPSPSQETNIVEVDSTVVPEA